MYRNQEGNPDPKAGMTPEERLFVAIMQLEKIDQTVRKWPRVYVCSRYAGDTEKNTKDAALACRFVAMHDRIPVASHLMYPNMGFEEDDPMQREMCLMFGLSLMESCGEVWCFTRDGIVSDGMSQEIGEAGQYGKKIRVFDMKKVRAWMSAR